MIASQTVSVQNRRLRWGKLFDMKLNSYSKAADGTIVAEVHFEGEADGFGVAF